MMPGPKGHAFHVHMEKHDTCPRGPHAAGVAHKRPPCVFRHGSLFYLIASKISHIRQGIAPVQLFLFYFLILRRFLLSTANTMPDTIIRTRYAAHGVLSAVCTELEPESDPELAVPLEAEPLSEM